MDDTQGPYLFDACTLICLEAADILGPVLRMFSGQCLVTKAVMTETQWVYGWPADDGSKTIVAIDLAAHVNAGLLGVVEPETDVEAEHYLYLAASVMDDGEAMSVAIARSRVATLVTDERIATSYCAREGIACLSSLHMVQAWALHEGISGSDIMRALTGIAQRARYRPGRAHPLRHWWDDHFPD